MLKTALAAVGVVGCFVVSAAHAGMTDDEARKAIADFNDSFVKTEQAGDAEAATQYFTEDGIRVGPRGIIKGKENIQRYYTTSFKVFKEGEDTVEDVRAIGDNAILVSGKWSGTIKEQRVYGFYSYLAVRDGSTWKIKADMFDFALGGAPTN